MFSPPSEPGYSPEEVVREMLLGRAKVFDPSNRRDTLPLKENVETFPEIERWQRESREANEAKAEAKAKKAREANEAKAKQENEGRSTSLAPQGSRSITISSSSSRRQLLQAHPGPAVKVDAAQIELNAMAVRQNPRDVNDDDHDDHDGSLERLFYFIFRVVLFSTKKQKVLHLLHCAFTFFHTCVSRSHPFSSVPIGFLCYLSSQNTHH